jgi:hypothetical protein
MSTRHEEKEPSFKVVDRRRFTDEGLPRPGAPEDVKEEPKVAAKPAEASEKPPAPKVPAAPAPSSVSFNGFVQTLAHQAMMGLGLAPWPDTGLVKVSLELAKETIDIILLLKAKCQGNLSKEEQALIDTLSYQLQMAFIEISKAPVVPDSPLIK